MSAEDMKTSIRRCLAEYSPSNQGVIDEVFAPGYQHHSQSGTIDLAGFKQGLLMYYSAFPDGKLEVLDVIGDGDRVVARMTFSGTNTAALFGMPPTGKRASMAMMTMYRFADGKVQEDWEMSDRLGMMQQLGVIPKPGA